MPAHAARIEQLGLAVVDGTLACRTLFHARGDEPIRARFARRGPGATRDATPQRSVGEEVDGDAVLVTFAVILEARQLG